MSPSAASSPSPRRGWSSPRWPRASTSSGTSSRTWGSSRSSASRGRWTRASARLRSRAGLKSPSNHVGGQIGIAAYAGERHELFPRWERTSAPTQARRPQTDGYRAPGLRPSGPGSNLSRFPGNLDHHRPSTARRINNAAERLPRPESGAPWLQSAAGGGGLGGRGSSRSRTARHGGCSRQRVGHTARSTEENPLP